MLNDMCHKQLLPHKNSSFKKFQETKSMLVNFSTKDHVHIKSPMKHKVHFINTFALHVLLPQEEHSLILNLNTSTRVRNKQKMRTSNKLSHVEVLKIQNSEVHHVHFRTLNKSNYVKTGFHPSAKNTPLQQPDNVHTCLAS